MKTLLLSLWLASQAFATTMAVSVGDDALLFTLPAINENAAVDAVGSSRVSLGDFVGTRPARSREGVVVFFFDSAKANEGTLGALDRLQRRYKAKGVQVVAVTTDPADLGSLSTTVEDLRLSFPVLRDRYAVVVDRYKTGELPVTVLIDNDGKVFAIGNPKGESLEGEVDGELAAMLAE